MSQRTALHARADERADQRDRIGRSGREAGLEPSPVPLTWSGTLREGEQLVWNHLTGFRVEPFIAEPRRNGGDW